MEGTAFSIDEASFDASLLPEGSRTPGSEAFHRAVTDYFERSYASMGGQLSVVFAAGRIEIAWEPAAPEEPAMATIGPLLQQRRFDEARPLLETLLQLQPEHPEALYNLGVLASEEGRLEEARLLLRRAVVANAPDAHAQANAQVALALAAMRLGDKAEARQALEAAIEGEPGNSFALRSLGSLLVIAGAYAAAVERFRQALVAELVFPGLAVREGDGHRRLGGDALEAAVGPVFRRAHQRLPLRVGRTKPLLPLAQHQLVQRTDPPHRLSPGPALFLRGVHDDLPDPAQRR